MPVISVINYKGGVGKTTVTANVAAQLACKGKKVLTIDLDPQANLTFSFLKVEDWMNHYQDKTIKKWYDAFIDDDQDFDLGDLIVKPKAVNQRLSELHAGGSISLISSHLGLINVDLELAAKLWGGSERTNRRNFLRVSSRLRAGLEPFLDKFDFILIDCPPNFNVVTKTAIVASEWLLIPAKPDFLSTLGIEQLRKHVDSLVEEFNAKARVDNTFNSINPEILGVVFTMVGIRSREPISALKQFIAQVERLKLPTLKTLIRDNKTIYAAAPQAGVPVVLEDVNPGTYLNVRTELEDLAEEIRAACEAEGASA